MSLSFRQFLANGVPGQGGVIGGTYFCMSRRAEACPSTGNPVRQAGRMSVKSASPQRVRLVADWKPNLHWRSRWKS